MTTSSSTHAYYMAICDARAKSCKCHSRQIGALIVKDEVIIPGYNGPPRGVPHCEEREVKLSKGKDLCLRRRMGFGSGEGMEHCIAAHAELNAILNAARQGICTTGTTLYLNDSAPCPKCMVAIIQAGIVAVVYDSSKPAYAQRELTDWLALHGGVRLVPFSRHVIVYPRDIEGKFDVNRVDDLPPYLHDIRMANLDKASSPESPGDGGSPGFIPFKVPKESKGIYCEACNKYLSDGSSITTVQVTLRPYATFSTAKNTWYFCSQACVDTFMLDMPITDYTISPTEGDTS